MTHFYCQRPPLFRLSESLKYLGARCFKKSKFIQVKLFYYVLQHFRLLIKSLPRRVKSTASPCRNHGIDDNACMCSILILFRRKRVFKKDVDEKHYIARKGSSPWPFASSNHVASVHPLRESSQSLSENLNGSFLFLFVLPKHQTSRCLELYCLRPCSRRLAPNRQQIYEFRGF